MLRAVRELASPHLMDPTLPDVKRKKRRLAEEVSLGLVDNLIESRWDRQHPYYGIGQEDGGWDDADSPVDVSRLSVCGQPAARLSVPLPGPNMHSITPDEVTLHDSIPLAPHSVCTSTNGLTRFLTWWGR